jgi:aspartyl protease family protein
LFTDAAVLRIDGQRKMLRAGQSFAGVTLVSAHSRAATLEVDGQRLELEVSRRIDTRYAVSERQEVKIPRGAALQYQTTASINGRQVTVMVDTGANVVAMSSRQASALGVNYDTGTPTTVETASGLAQAWLVTLASVNVGGIQVDNVQASVVEGDFPATILLGMTFLKHVKMQETDGILSLSRAR